MILHSLKVAHWRGLTVELPNLHPGLNLITGPNQAGKSRLVQALRFGLFESSNGQAEYKRELKTSGDLSAGSPRVEIEFELQGQRWTVVKEFLSSNETVLRGPRTLKGEAAETELAQLLGVSPPKTKLLEGEELGLWSLLWIEQGNSLLAPDQLNKRAYGKLSEVLDEEFRAASMGEVGQRLMAQVEAEAERYYTATAGRETKLLKSQRSRLDELTVQLDQARKERDQVAVNAERLEELERNEVALQQRLLLQKQHLQEALEQQQQLAELRNQLQLGEQQLQAQLEAQARREALDQQREDRHTELQQQQEQQAQAERTLAALEATLAERNQQVEQVEERQRALRTQLREQQRQQRHLQAQQEWSHLTQRQQRAQALMTEQAQTQKELDALPPLTLEQVQGLRKLDQDFQVKEATLQANAVRVLVAVGEPVDLNGERRQAGERVALGITGERTLALGTHRITIQPQGGKLEQLRDQFRDVQTDYKQELEALRVRNLAHAEEVLSRRQALEGLLRERQRELELQVPEGMGPLQLRLQQLQEHWGPALEEAPEAVDAAALEQLEQRESDLQVELERARSQRDQVHAQKTTTAEQTIALKTVGEGLRTEIQRLQTQLAAQPTQEQLERKVRTLKQEQEARQEVYQQRGGHDVEERVAQLTNAKEGLERQVQDHRVQVGQLRERVAQGSGSGSHEHVQELEATEEQLRTELGRLERQAAAAQRLREVLEAARQETQQRFTAPVLKRIEPHLQLLFPEWKLTLDDQLGLEGLRTDRMDLAFKEFSGGAREQISMLVRLGFAEVLGAEEPYPVVFDDALVNTDPERLQRMQKVLYRVAQKQIQILLFSCHGAAFDGLGPDQAIDLNTLLPATPE